MATAETDDHLSKIATNLAEDILALNGSMIPIFERWAKTDPRFARMLTGVWRNRMSDVVWMRLRAIQATVDDPLPSMIPLENGVEYMADKMKPEDRTTQDKGLYQRGSDRKWRKGSD